MVTPPRPVVVQQMPEADSPALQALESQLHNASAMPLEDQPLEQLLGGYQMVALQGDLSPLDRGIAASRIAQLQRNIPLARDLAEMVRMREQIRSTTLEQPPEAAKPEQYAAVGRLLASAVYDGTNLPRLFRLVDPVAGRTLAYLDPGADSWPLRVMGEIVGVVGEAGYDPALKLKIIRIDQIDVLEASSGRPVSPVAPSEPIEFDIEVIEIPALEAAPVESIPSAEPAPQQPPAEPAEPPVEPPAEAPAEPAQPEPPLEPDIFK